MDDKIISEGITFDDVLLMPALSAVDQVALLQNGKLAAFGPKEQILRSAPKPKLASVA